MHGVVVSYDQEKSYGFIRPSSGGQDIFFHVSEFVGRGRVRIGARVDFEVERSSRGYKAKRVAPAAFALNVSDLGPRMKFAVMALAAIALGTASLIFGRVEPLVAYLVACNIVAIGLFGYDKGIAGGTSTRVPEIVFHGIAAIGGTAGILVGMLLFRHKTQKASFQFGFAIILLLQIYVVHRYWEVVKGLREGEYSLTFGRYEESASEEDAAYLE